MINIKKKISLLTSLRIFAALLLLTLVLDIYDWQADILWYKQLIPFTYLYAFDATSTNNIAVLLVPLLINIALWLPCYYSYLFIMAGLYIELAKFGLMTPYLLMMLPFSPWFQRNNPLTTFLIVVFWLIVIRSVISKLKGDYYKKLFKTDSKIKTNMNHEFLKMAIVLCMIVAVTNAADYYMKKGRYNNISVPLETKRFDNNGSLVNQVKLSIDGKFFILRKSAGSNLTIFAMYDTSLIKNLENMEVFSVPRTIVTFTGYTLTNDNKYIIVGDKQAVKEGVNFQVYNLETRKIDDRFADTKKLSKFKSLSGNKTIDKIEFSQKGDYFALTTQSGSLFEIWDYIKGQLIYTEILPNTINTFNWISDSKFLVAYYSDSSNGIVNIMEYEMEADGNVVKTAKQDIAQSLFMKAGYTWDIKNSKDGKYIAVKSYKENGNDKEYIIDIWDIENQQKITTIPRTSKCTDMAFYPDNQRIVILDVSPKIVSEVSIWDIATGKKERELLVKGLAESQKIDIKVLDNGARLMIVNHAVHFVGLD